MNLQLIVFIVSGAGIVVLIGIKMLQDRLGLLLFWPDVRARGESFLQRQAFKIRNVAMKFSTRNLYIVLHYILVKVRVCFVYFQQIIDRKLVHLVNLIKGKKMIDARGAASHFLHDIHRFKDHFRRH